MIRVTRRRVLLAVLALFLVGVGYIAWTLAGLPPVKYYIRYGLDPYCEPTGEKETLEGVEYVEIGPGIFRMGSDRHAEGGDWVWKLCRPLGLPWGKQPRRNRAMPIHWVEFRRGFWIATKEITNAQFERFRPEHERSEYSDGDDTPAVDVTWKDVEKYCVWISRKVRRRIRLPSEAEWECVCRAGGDAELTGEGGKVRLLEHGWFDENSEGRAHAVATKRPNAWGLYDLYGNVWEWCEDTFHWDYQGAPVDGSAWTSGGEKDRKGGLRRVQRGGSFNYPAGTSYSTWRDRWEAYRGSWCLGFRLAFSAPGK